MNIEWNKVTRYSIVAIVVFLAGLFIVLWSMSGGGYQHRPWPWCHATLGGYGNRMMIFHEEGQEEQLVEFEERYFVKRTLGVGEIGMSGYCFPKIWTDSDMNRVEHEINSLPNDDTDNGIGVWAKKQGAPPQLMLY